MKYTEHKIDGNALPVAVTSVVKRFGMHGKRRYTDYGPYWWALKAVLRSNGHDFGAENDAGVASEYCGATDFETVIMADMFRDVNLATNTVGTKGYMLDGETGATYFLNDSDMEPD